MRKLLALFLAFAALTACSGGVSPEEAAMLAAKGYYEHLLRGEYEAFVEGKAETVADSVPGNYREQLAQVYRNFMALQQQRHNGIREVRAVSAKVDSTLNCTQVFLVLCFGDSTNEEVVVPMVERQGRWRMR